jgi:hypothetical protein
MWLWLALIVAWLVTAVLFAWVYAAGMASAPQSNNWRDGSFFVSLLVAIVLTLIKGSLLLGGEWYHGLVALAVLVVVVFFYAMSNVRWL